ncbi:MAG TPA: PaaI family thioesterase [Streptosporangiaceae bacterium]|nr:PaaI family thioesterase [Streptosporangiaceae bacterium]
MWTSTTPASTCRPGQKVSFLRPAAPGRITGTGRVVHRGGPIAFLAGELRDKTSDVLATATATVRIIRPHRH